MNFLFETYCVSYSIIIQLKFEIEKYEKKDYSFCMVRIWASFCWFIINCSIVFDLYVVVQFFELVVGMVHIFSTEKNRT